MNDLKIDSHKLMYHVDRLSKWIKGDTTYPIYMEISPSGACNHRCSFCAFEYLKYKKQFINTELLKGTLMELWQLGVKSVMYAGEGEPFLHKDMVPLILHTKQVGIDTAVATNGVLFTHEVAESCLSSLTWIRFSINAGAEKTYAKIHRCKKEDFNLVLDNVAEAVKIRNRNGYKCTIGVQCLLLPNNYNEILGLASQLKNIGVDYLTVKPFIKHHSSSHDINKDFDYSGLFTIDTFLDNIRDNNFKVYFRTHGMEKLMEKREYKRCLALPFFAEITSDGSVYTCGPYLGNKNFCYGNIYKNTFKEIWWGDRKLEVMKTVANLDINKCMKNCRLDEINKYLWDLTHPPEHTNFI